MRLGRFDVVDTLGSGGMGEVYRARDSRLGRDVAIKTVRNVFGVNASLFRMRFEAEARALAALSHPAIVQVHDLGFDDDSGNPYLVMELVDGPSLKARLADGPMPPGEVRAMGIQLARALEAAHARGILHRDVKPANVLLAPSGQWKLADFGVAHVPDSSATLTGQFLGTPAYAAPEAAALGQFSEQSDVFGLGALLVEALTGVRLRGDASLSEIVQKSNQAVAMPAGVPEEYVPVLQATLARDPDARPRAGQLADMLANSVRSSGGVALRGAAGVGSTQPTSGAIPVRPVAVAAHTEVLAPRASKRRRVAYLIAAAAGAILIVGLIAANSGGGDAPASAGSAAPSPAPPAAARTQPVEHEPERPHRPRDKHFAKEWDKILKELDKGKYDKAYEKLERFEERYGPTPESRALREQLAGYYGREYEEDDD